MNPERYEELQGKRVQESVTMRKGFGMAPAVTIPGVRVGHSSSGEREQGLGS